MSLFRCIVLVQFAATWAVGAAAQQSHPPDQSERVELVLVKGLYHEVLSRHPIGLPDKADMKALARYLSKSLLHRIDVARACEADYYRNHYRGVDLDGKPEIDWLEFGLFTGGNERVSPRAFHVERTHSEKDGSVLVYVRLKWGARLPPFIWHVAPKIVRENGHLAVDDIFFPKDEATLEDEAWLSELLTPGCDGPRWVGYPQRGVGNPRR